MSNSFADHHPVAPTKLNKFLAGVALDQIATKAELKAIREADAAHESTHATRDAWDGGQARIAWRAAEKAFHKTPNAETQKTFLDMGTITEFQAKAQRIVQVNRLLHTATHKACNEAAKSVLKKIQDHTKARFVILREDVRGHHSLLETDKQPNFPEDPVIESIQRTLTDLQVCLDRIERGEFHCGPAARQISQFYALPKE